MIRVENIKKSFGDLEVLKGIDLNFYKGKTNIIIGRSGAGKTVLLKLIVGLYPPTSGKIYYGDTDFLSLNARQLRAIRMKVGMLFQQGALFDSMTIRENIRFPLDMFSTMTLKEKNMKVSETLERVDLIGKESLFPSEASGGMQKRVGIARAIVLEPEYLFCDEPNSGLDPKTSILIDQLISNITHERNITTIINTHDMNSVMEIGENIALLADGYLEWQGHKSEVLASENEELHRFIFASPFLKKLRNKALGRAPEE
jgi:phospholipid/cholesterol/gamma-HCH transport system ATP-binding protein